MRTHYCPIGENGPQSHVRHVPAALAAPDPADAGLPDLLGSSPRYLPQNGRSEAVRPECPHCPGGPSRGTFDSGDRGPALEWVRNRGARSASLRARSAFRCATVRCVSSKHISAPILLRRLTDFCNPESGVERKGPTFPTSTPATRNRNNALLLPGLRLRSLQATDAEQCPNSVNATHRGWRNGKKAAAPENAAQNRAESDHNRAKCQ